MPWVLGLIATRSLHGQVEGIDNLVSQAELRIKSGMIAYGAMQTLRAHPDDAAARAAFDAHVDDLGYALLLKRYTPNVTDAGEDLIAAAALDTIPPVLPLFFTFRIMVALGFYFIALFGTMFVLASRRKLERHRWLLHVCLWSLPLPWIAAELGWVVAEVGRQPWTIDGVLPTFLSVSSVPAWQCLDLDRRLRAVLLGAGGGRGLPDGPHHPARARRAADSLPTPALGAVAAE